jgi:hypothetical protein
VRDELARYSTKEQVYLSTAYASFISKICAVFFEKRITRNLNASLL